MSAKKRLCFSAKNSRLFHAYCFCPLFQPRLLLWFASFCSGVFPSNLPF
jgi:hypothetical protein